MVAINDTAVRPRSLPGSNKRAEQTWLPSLGALAAVLGTIVAILSVPDDPQPRGALFWPAVWCSLGLLTAPVLGLRKTTQAILRTENLLMIGLIYWLLLDLLQGAYPLDDVSNDAVTLAFAGIGVFAVGLWVGMLGTGWSLPQFLLRAAKQQFSSGRLFGAVLIAFFLGMFWYAYSSDFDPSLMSAGLGSCRFCAPWSTGTLGGGDAFLVNLKYFGYVLPSLTVLLAHRDGWFRAKAIVSVILSLTFVAFLTQEGGRRMVGVTVGAAIMSWLLLQGRLRPKFLVGGLIGITTLLISMELMLEYRGVGFSADYHAVNANYQVDAVVHVDDNFVRLSQIAQFIPDVQPYLDLQPLAYVLTLPIPRVLWPGKPTGPGYSLPEMLGLPGVSLTASIIGDLYAMHGLVAVFIGGLLFGRLASMWNKVLAVPGVGKAIMYGFGVMVLFAGLRSMQDLIIMSYGLLGWLVVASLLRSTGSKTVARPG
jgi:hypothetical protein